jgi:hypothetical protein
LISAGDASGQASAALTALGVSCIGIIPVLALLAAGRSPLRPRLRWLAGLAVLGVGLAALSDGISAVSGEGLQEVGPRSSNVLVALRVGWVLTILGMAWWGRRAVEWRVAALLTTAHLLVVETLWLAGEAALRREFGAPGVFSGPPLGAGRMVFLLSLVLLVQLAWGAARWRRAAGVP